MKIINFNESNSILNQYVAEIRNVEVQNDRLRFRRNIQRIGEIMAYEISKTFSYSVKDIKTPLGIAPVSTKQKNAVGLPSSEKQAQIQQSKQSKAQKGYHHAHH